MEPFRVSFVCLGNICRSPTAEGVARHLITERGLTGIEVESAGTAAYHVGEPPDSRATATAAGQGITLSGASRKFDAADLDRLDLVVAMDRSNQQDLQALAGDHPTPIRLLREWDADADDLDVPDPYYTHGFDEVLDIVSRSVEALLDEITAGTVRRPGS